MSRIYIYCTVAAALLVHSVSGTFIGPAPAYTKAAETSENNAKDYASCHDVYKGNEDICRISSVSSFYGRGPAIAWLLMLLCLAIETWPRKKNPNKGLIPFTAAYDWFMTISYPTWALGDFFVRIAAITSGKQTIVEEYASLTAGATIMALHLILGTPVIWNVARALLHEHFAESIKDGSGSSEEEKLFRNTKRIFWKHPMSSVFVVWLATLQIPIAFVYVYARARDVFKFETLETHIRGERSEHKPASYGGDGKLR